MWEQRDRLTTQVGTIVAGEILAGRSVQLTGPAADAAPSSPAVSAAALCFGAAFAAGAVRGDVSGAG